ncbi:hypothetical protein [Haliangium ochraceum]|uniref:Uncharacterized protein n=1 Tax=Haliangium ochraceum (strain DSM 14365 / JCM 11303 / SMP-2) TaxID=502025 RepID=D0LML9_HALO1|nr:hypothetical protein [Haliangium ochraceum]ACY18706.1 hypothetical protein Hoch_6232 [Haliangium ochraceum DSM 14365]
MSNRVRCISAIAIALAMVFAVIALAGTARAESDDSEKIAKEVKLYIAKEHKKRRTDASEDFEKIHKLCTKNWAKGCRFSKASGKDKYQFQVRPRGKTYGIPTYLLK